MKGDPMSSTRVSLIIYRFSLTASAAGLVLAVVAGHWPLVALALLGMILAGTMILKVRKQEGYVLGAVGHPSAGGGLLRDPVPFQVTLCASDWP